MTVTEIPVSNVPLGPGTLKIGATGSEFEVSCLVNNAVITPSKDEGDSTVKLCGTSVPGAVSYTYALSGNMDTDVASAAGFFAFTQSMAGKSTSFAYTPNSDAGTTATGTLVVDPLAFGGDESGQPMASDFEFSIVDKPVYTFGDIAADAVSADDEQEELIPA